MGKIWCFWEVHIALCCSPIYAPTSFISVLMVATYFKLFSFFFFFANLLSDLVLSNKLVLYDLENQAIGWADYNCKSLLIEN